MYVTQDEKSGWGWAENLSQEGARVVTREGPFLMAMFACFGFEGERAGPGAESCASHLATMGTSLLWPLICFRNIFKRHHLLRAIATRSFPHLPFFLPSHLPRGPGGGGR